MDSEQKGKEGEQFVYELATDSFLSYWCFPNPKDELGDKKELCDLLIHFQDTLILCCVKNYEFKGAYQKYFRKVIEKDVRQLYGAERKITQSNYDIQIRNKDGRSHVIERNKIRVIYRLMIHLGDKVHFYPFNRITPSEAFVNIFDKSSFRNIIRFLDTIKDLENYLMAREAAFKDKKVLILPSEEEEFDVETSKQFMEYAMENPLDKTQILISGTESDLLANYIKNGRTFSKHIYSDEYNGMLFQIDGTWTDFLAKEDVKNKFQADKVSYFIDEFVKREVLRNEAPESIRLAKELLSFDRFSRRIISKHFFEFVETYNSQRGFFIARRFGEMDGIAIIFVFYGVDVTQEQINTLLPIVVDTYSVYTKYKHKKVILIATTKDFKQFKAGFMDDIKPFDKETEESVLRDMKLLNWFENTTEMKFHEKEYPGQEEKSAGQPPTNE